VEVFFADCERFKSTNSRRAKASFGGPTSPWSLQLLDTELQLDIKFDAVAIREELGANSADSAMVLVLIYAVFWP
jgi:hypothetical protein